MFLLTYLLTYYNYDPVQSILIIFRKLFANDQLTKIIKIDWTGS